MKPEEIQNLIPIDKEADKIANDIVEEKDLEKIKSLINLFNINQQKKNIVRASKLSVLLDMIAENILDRFKNHPDEFSNDDLLNYLTTIQTTIDKTTKNIETIDEIPPITMNQINVNVEETPTLNRESKEKVTEAVRKILERLNAKNENNEIIIEETDIPPEQEDETKKLRDEEDL